MLLVFHDLNLEFPTQKCSRTWRKPRLLIFIREGKVSFGRKLKVEEKLLEINKLELSKFNLRIFPRQIVTVKS